MWKALDDFSPVFNSGVVLCVPLTPWSKVGQFIQEKQLSFTCHRVSLDSNILLKVHFYLFRLHFKSLNKGLRVKPYLFKVRSHWCGAAFRFCLGDSGTLSVDLNWWALPQSKNILLQTVVRATSYGITVLFCEVRNTWNYQNYLLKC